jgi:hypothetical protein
MIRFGNALLLIGMGASLCGCASRQVAIRAEIQQPQRGAHEVGHPNHSTSMKPSPWRFDLVHCDPFGENQAMAKAGHA